MCGIAAIASFRGVVDGEALARATAALHHRGPDHRASWLSPNREIGLGHTRLAIIDLAGGNQPIANETEDAWIVHNGEFYDFERIRRDLERGGHRFRSGSDSEIALHLYEDLGAACLSSLRGEFAFVIWDQRNQQLFAARDRFGIKPLFYTVFDGALYLASEVKALFAAGVPARWDEEAFYSSALFQYMPGGRTLFAGVYQVPPGHFLIATEGDLRLVRYWDFDYAREGAIDRPLAEPEYVERFATLFDEAVRLRMRADVAVGCYLSGGIDSGVTLGVARRHAAKPIECYTLDFDTADYSEVDRARGMAALAGAHFHPVPIRERDIWDNFEEATYHSEALCVNGHGVAKFLLSRAVRDAGIKVVLVGEGADEVFAGYPHFRRDLLLEADAGGRQLGKLTADNPVSRGLMLPQGEGIPVDGVRRALGYVPALLEAKATLGYRHRPLLSDRLRAHFGERDPFRLFLDSIDVAGQLMGRHVLDRSLYLCCKLHLPGYVLVILGDRMEMAHSVEGRTPFLDHHLVEFSRALPVGMKIKDGVEKYIVRQAARPIVTESVFQQPKHPLLAPPMAVRAIADGGAGGDFVQDVLRSDELAALPFYDSGRLLAFLERVPAMSPEDRVASDPVLMMALSAAVLQRRFRPSAG